VKHQQVKNQKNKDNYQEDSVVRSKENERSKGSIKGKENERDELNNQEQQRHLYRIKASTKPSTSRKHHIKDQSERSITKNNGREV